MGYQVGQKSNDYYRNIDAINSRITSINLSMPDQTTTVDEKRKAVSAKNQIISGINDIINIGKKNNDTEVIRNFSSELPVLCKERDTILKEIAMIQKENKTDTTISIA